MNTEVIIISISEIISIIRTTFHKTTGEFKYNCEPYLMSIIAEIFCDNSSLKIKTRLPLSTRILIESGLEEEAAIELARIVFCQLVDSISTVVPNTTFGNKEKHSFDLFGEYDLKITTKNT